MTTTIQLTKWSLLMSSVKVAFVVLLQLKYVQALLFNLQLLQRVHLLVKRKDISYIYEEKGCTSIIAFKHCIDYETQVKAFYLSRLKRVSVRKVADFCGISKANVVKLSKVISSTPSCLRRFSKRRCEFKLSERKRRHLIRAVRATLDTG